MTRRKIFSIAHCEGSENTLHDDTFYHLIKNSSQGFKQEIHDIYFGKSFHYDYDGRAKKYGNCMGVEATDAQVESLFRIQNDFEIEISLTMNSIETPTEFLHDHKVVEKFVAFLKTFYDRGLRSCTIASPHIMRSGVLQDRFPEMRWKNTVNHRVATAQQVLDYIFCGYDTILLDRSICRNINELRKIRKAVDYYNKKYNPTKKVLISLLVREGCLGGCPFKKEHDSVGEQISGQYFLTTGKITCDTWRSDLYFNKLPRNALDLIAFDKPTFEDYARLCDILKFSGRFLSYSFKPGEMGNRQAGWIYFSKVEHRFDKKPIPLSEIAYADNITDALDDNIFPLHLWSFTYGDVEGNHYKDKLKLLTDTSSNIWATARGKRLAKILQNCKSQCWECHECENTFGTRHLDSALQIGTKEEERSIDY